MAQVTPQDISDAGFRREQFGTPADWDVPMGQPGHPGYLQRLIARAELWARGRFGADAYGTLVAGTVTAERMRAAELCWVSAQLWKRRAAFIDSNAVSALENMAYLDRREFEAQAVRAMECAEAAIVDAGAPPLSTGAGGVALAHVVTGTFGAGVVGVPGAPGRALP